MKQLRDYQQETLDNVYSSLKRGNKHIIVQSPPRSGKTIIMAEITKRSTAKNNRVLFFSHRKEINEQVEKTFSGWGVDMDLVDIFNVSTLAKRLDNYTEDYYSLVLVDEAHHIKAGNYIKILEKFKQATHLYFTGTPIRLSGEGFDDMADDIVLGKSVKWLQEKGFIAPFKYYSVKLIDDKKLKKRAGEYTKQSIMEASGTKIYGDVIDNYEKLGRSKQAIVYCATVEQAHEMARQFRDNGYTAESVDGKTDKDTRARIMQQFRDKEIRILLNCELFTEGVDLPDVDVCIQLRPTASLSLFLQFAMRSLNPREGKEAIIIDHVGNVLKHGLPNDDREWSLKASKTGKKKIDDSLPVRECPTCFSVWDSSLGRVCPYCSTEIPLTITEIEEIKEAELMEYVATVNKPSELSTVKELHAYAKLKGYKPGWAYMQQKKRNIWK